MRDAAALERWREPTAARRWLIFRLPGFGCANASTSLYLALNLFCPTFAQCRRGREAAEEKRVAVARRRGGGGCPLPDGSVGTTLGREPAVTGGRESY